MALHPLDLAIIAAYLLGMIGIGWAVSGRVRAFSDFFVAGRSLTTPVLICSLVSSYYGLDVLFGDAGDAAREGVVVYFVYMRPYTLMLLVAALLVARRLRGRPFLSLPDVLAHHYGRPTQVASAVASFFYALPILAIMGLAALGQVLFDIPLWLGALAGSGIALLYTLLGGFWADALTDTAQFLIMCVSLAVAVPFALQATGGFDGIETALGPGHFEVLGTAPPLYTLAYALTALSVLVEPAFYQRIFAARDRATVVRAFLWGIVIWAAYDWAVTTLGMAGGVMLGDGRLPAGTPADQVLLRTTMALLPVGLCGFFLGGCLATAMSTLDSYLLIAAGNVVYDLYRPAARRTPTDAELIRYTRLSMVAAAGVCIAIGLYFERIKEAWNFMATILTSTVLVPMLGALFLRPRPLSGTLSAWGGLSAVALFFVAMQVFGTPREDLETLAFHVAGVEILREYALFFALPISAGGYLLGAALTGRRK